MPTAVAVAHVRLEYPCICSADGRMFVNCDASPVRCIDAPESKYAFCFAIESFSTNSFASGRSVRRWPGSHKRWVLSADLICCKDLPISTNFRGAGCAVAAVAGGLP